MFFKKKNKVTFFIEPPMPIDIKKPFLTDIYKYAYLPMFSIDKLEANGINGINNELYNLTVTTVKNIIYQLYQVPAVRKYFGTDFTHHISAEYDKIESCIRFVNIEDSENSEQYLKELTLAIAFVFKEFLDEYDIVIFYRGETFHFLYGKDIPKGKNIARNDRIIWYI